MKPKYLARKTDGSVLKLTESGRYVFMESKMGSPYQYHISPEMMEYFEVVTEEDFPRLKGRGELYNEFLIWYSRSDGHGDIKGGTMEEFLEQRK